MEINRPIEGVKDFATIVENCRDIVTLIDSEGNILKASPAFYNRFGYEFMDEASRHNLFSLIHKDDVEAFKRNFEIMVAGNTTFGSPIAEFRLQGNDDSWRYVDAIVSNLLEFSPVNAVIVNYRDVTEYKESLKELAEYQSKLEDMIDQRTQELKDSLEKEKEVIEQQRNFIAMVSHEFRTPLTIIDGNAQIIQSRGNTLELEMLQRRALTIRKAVDRLVGLIERILSGHSRDGGDLEIFLTPCDFASMVRNICIEKLSIEPNAKIQLDIKRGMPNMMLDEKLVQQVIQNLITNAFKYSKDEPDVKVSVYTEDDKFVCLAVSDNGVGIPADEMQKIFTKFFRASTSVGIPGTGLGLNLVKEIAELHGGSTHIESEVDMGTTITVKFPVILPEDGEELKVFRVGSN